MNKKYQSSDSRFLSIYFRYSNDRWLTMLLRGISRTVRATKKQAARLMMSSWISVQMRW